MGVKRPLEEENIPELSFEKPKQLDGNKKLASSAEDLPSGADLKVDSPGELKSSSCKLPSDGMLKSGGTDGAFMADKELEASVPLSFVTSSSGSSEEDFENKESSFSSNFPGYLDFYMPWRPPEQFDDPYVYLLNVPPRKVVPVGPDHQAEVPKWDPSATGKNFSEFNNTIDNEWEQKMMGTCISTLPGLNDSGIDVFTIGHGRTECSCVDMGTVRCVQQHVKEAREKLRDAIGDETFTKLGFYEMGEEVACKWTAEDEKLFHEVVVTNPVSHVRNFWKLLEPVFPTRTKKELVSYYFNVFVLRRRGIQNRSYLLQIDSDDDEEPNIAHPYYCLDEDVEDVDNLQHMHGGIHLISVDEDSEVVSFGDQDLDAGWVDEFKSEPQSVCDDEGSTDNHGMCDCNASQQDGVEMDIGTEQTSEQETK